MKEQRKMRMTLEAPSWEPKRFVKTVSGSQLTTNVSDWYPLTGMHQPWLHIVLELPQLSFLCPVAELRAEICNRYSWDYLFPKWLHGMQSDDCAWLWPLRSRRYLRL